MYSLGAAEARAPYLSDVPLLAGELDDEAGCFLHELLVDPSPADTGERKDHGARPQERDPLKYERKKDRAKLHRKVMTDLYNEMHRELQPKHRTVKATDRTRILRAAIDEIRTLRQQLAAAAPPRGATGRTVTPAPAPARPLAAAAAPAPAQGLAPRSLEDNPALPHVLSFLLPYELLRLSRCSRALRAAALSDAAWRGPCAAVPGLTSGPASLFQQFLHASPAAFFLTPKRRRLDAGLPALLLGHFRLPRCAGFVRVELLRRTNGHSTRSVMLSGGAVAGREVVELRLTLKASGLQPLARLRIGRSAAPTLSIAGRIVPETTFDAAVSDERFHMPEHLSGDVHLPLFAQSGATVLTRFAVPLPAGRVTEDSFLSLAPSLRLTIATGEGKSERESTAEVHIAPRRAPQPPAPAPWLLRRAVLPPPRVLPAAAPPAAPVPMAPRMPPARTYLLKPHAANWFGHRGPFL